MMETAISYATLSTEELISQNQEMSIESDGKRVPIGVRDETYRMLLKFLNNETLSLSRDSISPDFEGAGSIQQNTSSSDEDYFETYNKIRANIDKISKITKFKKNWDGYGAEPIEDTIINKAERIIKSLIRQPKLFPTGRSTIQLEYEKDKDYLEFEIYSDRIEIYQEKDYTLVKDEVIQLDEINLAIEKFYAD